MKIKTKKKLNKLNRKSFKGATPPVVSLLNGNFSSDNVSSFYNIYY